MALKTALTLAFIAVTLPLSAAQAQSMAPPAGPDARYCLRVDPVTGSNVETVQCWTRTEWFYQDVDVDREWARWGIGVIG